MTRLSRNLAVAGLAIAGGEAIAATPLRLWQHATHFGMTCQIAGESAQSAAVLCARLAPLAARMLGLPDRTVPDATGITLTLRLARQGNHHNGTIVATRPALEGETDESSPIIPISFDSAAPEAGLSAALARLRAPLPRGPATRPFKPIQPH